MLADEDKRVFVRQTTDGWMGGTTPGAASTAWNEESMVSPSVLGQEPKSPIILFHYTIPSTENYISDR